MNMKKRIWIACAPVLLIGCAAPYVPPTSGPTAKIQFVNDAGRNLVIAHYDQSRQCVGRRSTDVIPPGHVREDVIRADQDITFQYHLTNYSGGAAEGYCLVNLRFMPKAGHHYVFRTNETSKSCHWHMTAVIAGGGHSPEELKKIPWKKGFDESSSFCNE